MINMLDYNFYLKLFLFSKESQIDNSSAFFNSWVTLIMKVNFTGTNLHHN